MCDKTLFDKADKLYSRNCKDRFMIFNILLQNFDRVDTLGKIYLEIYFFLLS